MTQPVVPQQLPAPPTPPQPQQPRPLRFWERAALVFEEVGLTIYAFWAAIADLFKRLGEIPAKLLRLFTYGDNEQTNKLLGQDGRDYIVSAGQILAAIWLHQFVAFQAVFGGAFVGPLAGITLMVICAGFATVSALIDRAFFVSNTRVRSGSGIKLPFVGKVGPAHVTPFLRVIAVAVISYSVGQMYAVRQNERDIDLVLDKKEKKAMDAMRENAIDIERKKFEQRVQDRSGIAQGDLDKDREEWTKRRKELEAKHADEIKTKEKSLADLEQRSRNQVDGTGGAVAGRGPKYRQFAQELEDARTDLKETRERHARERADFDTNEQRAIGGSTAKRNAETASGRAELDRKIAELRVAPIERIADEYGGTYKVVRTPLARYSTLKEIRRENPDANDIVNIMIALAMVFEMMLLIKKMLAPKSVKDYYDDALEAASGNEAAATALKLQGYEDAQAHARLPEVQEMVNKLTDLRIAAVEQLTRLRQLANVLATTKGTLGLHKSHGEILSALHRFSLTGQGAQDNKSGSPVDANAALTRHSELMATQGMEVPEWPANLNGGVDPRTVNNAWDIPRAHLAEMGWEDPEAAIVAARAAQADHQGLQQQLFELIRRELRSLDHNARSRSMPFAAAARMYQEAWEDTMTPILFQMAEAERTIAMGGLAPHPWPPGFEDPRPTLKARFCDLSADDLRAKGWSEPAAPRAATASN